MPSSLKFHSPFSRLWNMMSRPKGSYKTDDVSKSGTVAISPGGSNLSKSGIAYPSGGDGAKLTYFGDTNVGEFVDSSTSEPLKHISDRQPLFKRSSAFDGRDYVDRRATTSTGGDSMSGIRHGAVVGRGIDDQLPGIDVILDSFADSPSQDRSDSYSLMGDEVHYDHLHSFAYPRKEDGDLAGRGGNVGLPEPSYHTAVSSGQRLGNIDANVALRGRSHVLHPKKKGKDLAGRGGNVGLPEPSYHTAVSSGQRLGNIDANVALRGRSHVLHPKKKGKDLAGRGGNVGLPEPSYHTAVSSGQRLGNVDANVALRDRSHLTSSLVSRDFADRDSSFGLSEIPYHTTSSSQGWGSVDSDVSLYSNPNTAFSSVSTDFPDRDSSVGLPMSSYYTTVSTGQRLENVDANVVLHGYPRNVHLFVNPKKGRMDLAGRGGHSSSFQPFYHTTAGTGRGFGNMDASVVLNGHPRNVHLFVSPEEGSKKRSGSGSIRSNVPFQRPMYLPDTSSSVSQQSYVVQMKKGGSSRKGSGLYLKAGDRYAELQKGSAESNAKKSQRHARRKKSSTYLPSL